MSSKRVIVITGCSSGIGLETAVLLAKEENFKVIATMRNLQKKDTLERTAGESLNKSLFIRVLDVSKEQSILEFVKQTYESDGRIDVLVNNAGITQFEAFENFTMEQMHRLFQTNVFGTARITQEVVRRMKRQKSGQIIFVSSVRGISSVPFMDFYSASKHAVEGLVGSLAPVMRLFNVSVSSVQPGPVETSLGENVTINKMGKNSLIDGKVEDDPDLDDETNVIRKNLRERFGEKVKSELQSSYEVALVIKRCIEEEGPHMRVQTNVFTEKLASQIMTDPTGDDWMDSMIALIQ